MFRLPLTAAASLTALVLSAPAALAAAGDLDRTWGQQGSVDVAPAAAGDQLVGSELARQSVGTVVASTSSRYDETTWTYSARVQLGRLDAAGRFDPRFGAGGAALVDFGRPAVLRETAVLAGDEIAVLAAVGGGAYEEVQTGLAMLSRDGSPVPAFGSGAPVVVDPAAPALSPTALLADAGGGLLVGFDQDGRGTSDFALARFRADGRLDPTFGTGGVRLLDVGGDDHLTDLVRGPSGELFAVGFSAAAGRQEGVLARLRADGTLDRRFGSGGAVRFAPAGRDVVTGGAVVSGRSLAVGGTARVRGGSESAALVTRLSLQGRVENAFGARGHLLLDEPGQEEGAGVFLTPRDTLLVVRRVGDGPFTSRLHEVRARSGAPVTSFGVGGTVELGEFLARDVLVDGTGLLIAGARFDPWAPTEVVQRRL
ncbi:putative delta-60 repeat protein [Kineococcus xinjiangensis]|uniref:Putative delta-60 repeat protein n=1 Tax=Kineococcus xinjiangensis TaxID=512762 RepID=A0A2S6IMD0_9ACTN|nr:hypothetical protein [Kineococcus xinjiangensis]PPK95315.1 putative delta-60 repeat protein [Kineococcus xinjiangensis]